MYVIFQTYQALLRVLTPAFTNFSNQIHITDDYLPKIFLWK